MRLLSLDIAGIGPFDKAHLDFREEPGSDSREVAPVTFVTGENGTGKSIVIDTIRAIFGEEYGKLGRSIMRDNEPCEVKVELVELGHEDDVQVGVYKQLPVNFSVSLLMLRPEISFQGSALSLLPEVVARQAAKAPRWVLDYWQSSLDIGSFDITAMKAPDHRSFLKNSLQGVHHNTDTTEWICHFDYLRNSDDPAEKRNGELLYETFQIIAKESLRGGRFVRVARSRLEPVFWHHGRELGIGKLSAGSLYMIQRMLGLLGRMYSCHVMTGQAGQDDEDIRHIPGLLLIDEAENHLHPKLQKRLLPAIRTIFPNLQIIVATHSPFLLASVHDARVYVCESQGERCTVTDATADYADRPIDEILMSPAFAETRPFSQEITDLLEQHRAAIESGNQDERDAIEKKLLDLNPEYFDYFHIDTLLARIAGGARS